MKKHIIAAGLLLGLACAGQALAQTSVQSGQDIARSVQNVYAGIQTFEAEFTQELLHQEAGTTETRQGNLRFAKPLLVRWETYAPYPELLLLTSQDIWNYLPDEDLAYRYSLNAANDAKSILTVITGQSPLDGEFEIEVMPQEQGLLHLLLYPFEPSYQMVEVQLWLDPSSYMIRKAQIMDFYGNLNTITFNSMAAGVRHPAGTFEFTPPRGTDVEDHRE